MMGMLWSPQFSLIAGLFKYFFSKTEIHILILGLDHAGKTVSQMPCYREPINNLILIIVSMMMNYSASDFAGTVQRHLP